MKFAATFCADCNNRRSQPFDRAYDRFIGWYLDNEDAVERSGTVAFEEIYDDWREELPNLLRYYVKHIACRIADAGFVVPTSLGVHLDGRCEPSGLFCSFQINGTLSGINAIIKAHPTQHGTAGNLFLGPVEAQLQRSNGHAMRIGSWWSYHGLQLVWEWNGARAESGVNLTGPTAELPRVNPAARRGLIGVTKSGVRGGAWRSWYRLRRALGLGPELH